MTIKEQNIPTLEDLWDSYWMSVNPDYGNPVYQEQAEKDAKEEFNAAIDRIRAEAYREGMLEG